MYWNLFIATCYSLPHCGQYIVSILFLLICFYVYSSSFSSFFCFNEMSTTQKTIAELRYQCNLIWMDDVHRCNCNLWLHFFIFFFIYFYFIFTYLAFITSHSSKCRLSQWWHTRRTNADYGTVHALFLNFVSVQIVIDVES